MKTKKIIRFVKAHKLLVEIFGGNTLETPILIMKRFKIFREKRK